MSGEGEPKVEEPNEEDVPEEELVPTLQHHMPHAVVRLLLLCCRLRHRRSVVARSWLLPLRLRAARETSPRRHLLQTAKQLLQKKVQTEKRLQVPNHPTRDSLTRRGWSEQHHIESTG